MQFKKLSFTLSLTYASLAGQVTNLIAICLGFPRVQIKVGPPPALKEVDMHLKLIGKCQKRLSEYAFSSLCAEFAEVVFPSCFSKTDNVRASS